MFNEQRVELKWRSRYGTFLFAGFYGSLSTWVPTSEVPKKQHVRKYEENLREQTEANFEEQTGATSRDCTVAFSKAPILQRSVGLAHGDDVLCSSV